MTPIETVAQRNDHILTDKRIEPALRILEGLVDYAHAKKYPTIPRYARTRARFNDQSTNALTQAILAAFKVHEIFATRLDSKGTYSVGLGRFIPSQQRKGMPDVSALIRGKAVYVEVKCRATRDRIRPDQEATIAELRRHGATVFIAENFESFWTWLMIELKHARQESGPDQGEGLKPQPIQTK